MSDPTFAELVAAREYDDTPAVIFEGRSWSWREAVTEARRRVALVWPHRPAAGEPWHIGLFLENTAEHVFWWLAAALDGATAVGLNPTRRGPDLQRDITFTDCRIVVVDSARRPLLPETGLPLVEVDAVGYDSGLAALPPAATGTPTSSDLLSLVFTSGTTSAPKAVICTQGRMGRIAGQQVERRGLTAADTFYVVMPLFHSNAVMAGLAPAVATGATLVVRRRFSASNWLSDVRKHGVTFFNYVGKPLNYILATPERPDDAENPLRIAFGNEASERDIARFAERFGCTVIDSFGSSEGEIQIVRTPDTPSGALGRSLQPGVVVLDPETLQECPPAAFDEQGRLTNGDVAIGEIVNRDGAALFEGYWRNPEAEQQRLRHGWTWSGDLAYRDEAGFFYFAGRTGDWLRVDGENLAAAPIERLLLRYPGFGGVAVVATPDPAVGDQVLAVVELSEPFDPEGFRTFLDAQPDLGTKWAPAFIKVTEELPRTPSNKVIKRQVDRGLASPLGVWERHGSTYRLREAPPR
ncbi:AMP-binding protein [Nocardioides daejeonensis]|uniref:AMP-binding protein n=1 Tax=Nocardioides daejeonensis TaxID=1046556 RepID=UPI000D74A8D1|nr:AMP-binding protein [Nocardioides daejeonensis]